MFLCSAVLKRYLSRLGPQSRFGDKLLGIRVRYMFLYSAVLQRYWTRLGPQSRFGDKLLGSRVRYMFLYGAVIKRCFISFRTAVPFWGNNTWNQNWNCFCRIGKMYRFPSAGRYAFRFLGWIEGNFSTAMWTVHIFSAAENWRHRIFYLPSPHVRILPPPKETLQYIPGIRRTALARNIHLAQLLGRLSKPIFIDTGGSARAERYASMESSRWNSSPVGRITICRSSWRAVVRCCAASICVQFRSNSGNMP